MTQSGNPLPKRSLSHKEAQEVLSWLCGCHGVASFAGGHGAASTIVEGFFIGESWKHWHLHPGH